MRHFIDSLLIAVKEHAGQPAVSDEFGTFTYSELFEYSKTIAGNLIEKGIKRSDKVIVEIPRCKEYAGCLIGCWLAGAVAIPLSDDYPKERLEYIKKDSNYVLSIDEAFIKGLDLSVKLENFTTNMEDESLIIYTSGSTGNPKGVIHDFYSMAAVAGRNAVHDQADDTERNNVVGLVAPFTFIVGVGLFISAVSLAKHLVLVPDEIRRDPFKLAKYYDDNNVESSFVPPRMVNFMLEHNKSLKVISVGSERITNLFFDDNPVIINGYGSTELFGGTLAFRVDKKYDNTPIGKPFGEEKVYVLDDKNNEVELGELCISGHVAKGYLNREKESKKVFIKNPFKDRDGFDFMFRTGDIVQRLDDDNLVFIERKDWMIKINGQRVEPLEVESTIRRISGIKEAAIKDFTDKNGVTYLVAYYVSDDSLDPDKVKEFCKANLTSYMVPSFYLKMDKLPLNPNGKLDRINLPEPDISMFKGEYVAPENKIEEEICNAIEIVLKCGQIGRNDDFFLLGGDSVKAMETINILKDLPLDIETFFEGRTPKDIALLIENGGKEELAFERVEKSAYPLTSSQLGVYFAMVENPNTLMYNNPIKIELDEDVNLDKLISSVEKAVNNHKAYHCHIDEQGGLPCMVFDDRHFSVKKCKTDNIEQSLKEFVSPFDIKNGELIRACVFEDKVNKVLALDGHHIVFDGTTLSVLLREIERSYCDLGIFDEKTSAFDLSTYEEALKKTDKYVKAKEFFENMYEGRDVSNNFPCDFEDKNDARLNTINVTLSLKDEKLLKFLKENNLTENSLFLSVFSYVLAKYNGTDSSLVCVAESGRHTSMTFNTAGMLVKTLALPVDLKTESDIVTYIRNLQETFRSCVKNDVYPFSELAGKYGLTNDFMFVYQGDSFTSLEINNKKYRVTGLFNPDAINKLTLMVFNNGPSYTFSFRYRSDLYSEDVIKAFADAYSCAVNEFMTKELINEVNLLSKQQEKVLDSFCSEEFELKDKTIAQFFDENVKKYPDNDLVVFNDKHITYAQADKITNRIANYIISLGLKTDDVVSILIPRNEWMVLATYGVIKTGCAYEPLDSSYPSERLSFMVKNANAKLLITTKDLVSLIKDYSSDILFVEDIKKCTDEKAVNVKTEPEDNIILLYTSGTTGNPKGVQLTQKNASAIAQLNKRKFNLNKDTRSTCYASYGFDACFNDLVSIPISGGSIYIIPEEKRLDFNWLDKYLTDNKITNNVMTTQVGRQFALFTKSPYLKYFSVGGEALVPFNTDNLTFNFYNLYGPTECTVYVSGTKVTGDNLRVPIGKINENTKGYVVDKNMNRLPVGAPGELLIGGCQVSKGYLNLPEKTEEVFIDNPFTEACNCKKLYRTGDIVRFLPNGMLDYIGRHDTQVKIRGFRIELSEIEEVVRRFEGIKDATVAAFDTANGTKFIACYVVSDCKVDINALNNFIASEKPSYMVPEVTMQIDSIPLNQNHKVNKRALPKPVRNIDNIVLPENNTQQTIYDICCNVLGHSDFGIDTDLHSAGLTSIAMISLDVELEKVFNVPFKVSDIKEFNTVKLIEKFINSSEQIQEYEVFEDYPLTQTQMGIYVECSLNPNAVTYNIPMLMKLDPSLDISKLVNAIKTALNAHPYTKAILFSDSEGNIRAKRNDSIEVVVDLIKCKDLPSQNELVRPFTLLGERLYRISIFETDSANYLFMDFHHIASDGMSENIILSDISKAYDFLAIDKERYTGFEVSLDEENARKSERYSQAKEYYDSVFKGCEVDCLPLKAPESETLASNSLTKIAKTSASDVIDYCRKNKVTPNAFFNSAFGYALGVFTNSEDAIYTTIYNGRSDSRLSTSVTMLVKTLPVMVHLNEESVYEMIQKTQKQLIDSMSNDIYSFAEISSSYGIHSDILFAYQGSEFTFDKFCSKKTEFVKVTPNVAKSPITITVFLKDGKYEINVDYRSDMFNKTLIDSFVDVFDLVLTGFTEKEKAKDISVLSEDAKVVLDRINNTDYEFENIAVSRLIERKAKENPDKIAVVSSTEKLTYKELNDRANRICAKLIKLGVKEDSIVGLLLNRTVDIPVCELAVLKAGGAFLPMLPEYPDDRIDFCFADSDSKLVITSESIKDSKNSLFTDDKNYKALTLEDLLLEEYSSDPEITPKASSLAYCIYTSGSTGKPKGVMIEHHNLSNFVQTFTVAKDMYARKDGGDVGLAFGSISFDIHIIEILLTLCNGKTVCLATENEVHNPDLFSKLLVNNNVDVIACTPSFITNMLGMECFERALKGLKSIMIGAEAFPSGLYEKLKKMSPDLYIVNAYGPTECTVSSSAKHITGSKNITIGGPALNYKYYIMDKQGRKLPPYATGELIICGEGVGRGYINLPEKNKASFFEIDGIRAYHSGDVGRLNKDGEVEFSGRMDNQVKLRGYRVELDEIENAIKDFEGITSSKVIVRNNGSEDYLVGFFTATEKIDVDSLTAYLKGRLTYYMVPDAMMQLEKMPLTQSGKIDKKALPEIKKESKKKERKAPKKSLEQELCDLFKSVLNLEDYYADDNFFEMGGTSLSASRVVMQLMSKGIKVEYQNIFDNPTPEMLSDYVESLNHASSDKEKLTDNSDIVSDYPEQLQYNTLEYAKEVKREKLGTVLLTGATGFLGIHVLKELLDVNEGKVICLLRRGKFSSPEKRLINMLMYYFDDTFDSILKERVSIIEADITNDLTDTLKDVEFDTIINCAACVKHYAADDILEKINVGGVENLIKVAMSKNARLVQISTVSIPGAHTEETWKKGIKGYENKLFVIDAMGNKYGLSKYHAELKILEAVKNGMRGKIIRVGNLMGRHKDGEFQINFETNAFLNAVRGFATIGKSPISHATDPMSFSPIDMTARAVVLLSGTNDMFTAFNADSRFRFDEWQLIEAANKCGIKITPVSDDEYYADYHRMLGDPKINAKLQGLMTNDRPDIRGVESDNKFTTNILYRLGFSWPLPDSSYLERTLASLLALDYFEIDEEI